MPDAWVELLLASLALKDFFLIVSKTPGKFLPQDGIGDYLSVSMLLKQL